MLVLPSAIQQFQLEAAFSLLSPQKYTQHLLSGTPAFHDHAHVGVRSQPAATSNQSPSFCKGIRGTPFTNCMSSEHFGQLAWQFKRMSGSSGLKVQAAIAC